MSAHPPPNMQALIASISAWHDRKDIAQAIKSINDRLVRAEMTVGEMRAMLGVLMTQKVERALDPKAAEREINRVRVLAAIQSAEDGKTFAELRRGFVRLPAQDIGHAVTALMASGAIKLVNTNEGREKTAGGRVRARLAYVATEGAVA